MNETLFCGIDLHSNNAMYVITDAQDRPRFRERLPNELPVVLAALEPYRQRLKVGAVESTYRFSGRWSLFRPCPESGRVERLVG
jgi:hypothetical protein